MPNPNSSVVDQILGPAGALAGAILIILAMWRAFSNGVIRVGKQVDAELAKARADFEAQLIELRKDRDWWRQIAIDALGAGEQLVKGGRQDQ